MVRKKQAARKLITQTECSEAVRVFIANGPNSDIGPEEADRFFCTYLHIPCFSKLIKVLLLLNQASKLNSDYGFLAINASK
jgi:hypothetical protein